MAIIFFLFSGHDLDSCILIHWPVVQKVAAFLLSCILIGLQWFGEEEDRHVENFLK